MTQQAEPADLPLVMRDRLVGIFKDGFLSVCVFRNVIRGQIYYDAVVYRKVVQKDSKERKMRYIRGPNLKPEDLPLLRALLQQAEERICYLRRQPTRTSDLAPPVRG